MQILSIHLRNIKSHRDTELSFSAGINVLSGPNGAGKSTIFEAVGYALFGVDAKDFVSNVERFLSIGAKKGEVSVVFRTDDGETYRVSRTVGAGAKWLLARESGAGFEVEDHARMEETEARIAGLLGLDNGRPLAEQFKLVIGPFQNDFLGPFVIRQPTRRQEAFDEILGIDAWRKTYKGTSGLLSAVQERMKVLAAEVAGKQEQLAVLPEKAAELIAIKNDAAARQLGVMEKETALTALETLLTELDSREKGIAVLGCEVALLESRIKDGEGKIAEQRIRLEESQKALKIVEESRGGREAFEKAEGHLVGLRQQEQQRRAVEQQLAGLEKESLRLTQALEHERAEIERNDRQLAADLERMAATRMELQADPQLGETAARLPELRQEAERLRGERALLEGRRESLLEGKEKLAEGICPFFQEQCRNIAGTPPRDVFSSRIDGLDRQMSDLDSRIRKLALQVTEAEAAEKDLNARKIRLQELEKQALALDGRRSKNMERAAGLDILTVQQTEAAQAVETLRVALKIYADLDREIAQSEQERSLHQAARDAFTTNLNASLDLVIRNQQMEKMQQLLAELTEQLKARQADLSERKGSYRTEHHLQVRREKELLLSEVATLRQQLIDLEKNVERLDTELARLKRIEAEVESKQAEIKSYGEKEKLVKFLRNQLFKNVSTQLSERFREEISLRADRIYRTIADSDEELHWGENYQIVLRDMRDGTIRERSDEQLSGGQMMSAVVALRLALLQTIGARIAFFDEPTSNLDATRRENLAHAFRAIDVGREEVTEHWYDQLFLVSHDVAFTEITDRIIELG